MGAMLTDAEEVIPVRVGNRQGNGPFVILCDHASNHIPAEFGTLGLNADELTSHIAWDPGALAVARLMASSLDAALVESCISRLVVDCNRPPEAPDMVPEISELTPIPGNQGLSAAERQRRIRLSHVPFHAAIESLVEERLSARRDIFLVSIHSFTPIYKGIERPWHIGIIHDQDMRLAEPTLEALSEIGGGMIVGDNQPYSPADRVYYTLERHARSRGLPCMMIEIRNDEIATTSGQRQWAELLSEILAGEARVGVGTMGTRMATT